MRLVILLLCVAVAAASSIVSTLPLAFHQDGQLISKQVVTVKCTDINPFEFQVTRADGGGTDTVRVECKRPKIRYNQAVYSYVPWSVQYKIPILEMPEGTNFTNGSVFEVRHRTDALANSDTSKTSIDEDRNLLQERLKTLRSNRLEIQKKLDNLHKIRIKLEGNTEADDPTPQPPKPPGTGCDKDAKAPGCLPLNPDGSVNLDAFRKQQQGLVSWKQISAIEITQDVLQGVTSLVSQGLLQYQLLSFNKQMSATGKILAAEAEAGDKVVVSELSTTLMGGEEAILAIAPIVITSLALAGKSPLDLVMKDIKILIGGLLEIDRTIEKYEQDQQNFDMTQNNINTNYDLEIGYINNRLALDEENIAILSNQTQLLQREINKVVLNVDGRFNQLASTLVGLFGAESSITKYLNDLDSREIRRFKSVYNSMQKLVLALEANADAIEAVRTAKATRRLAAAYYHDLLRKMQSSPPAAGPLLPFVDDTGTPPMSYDAIQALRTKDKALLMAEVLLQGTFYTASGYYASETSVAILCDPTKIANFSTAVNFDFILRLIGPSTPDAPHCFDTGNAWFCDCVFRVNETNIKYSGVYSPPQAPDHPLFPFEFTGSGTPMWLNPQTYLVFKGCTQDTLAMGTCTEEYQPLAFFDVLEDFEARLKQLCQFQWQNNRVRVITPRLGRLADVSVNPANFDAGYVCESDYYNITGIDFPGNNTLIFSIFRGLSLDFTAYFQQTQARVERQLYGVAGQAEMRQYLGSRYPSFTNAYRSYELDIVGLVSRLDAPIPRAVPVYQLVKASEVFEISFSINEQDTVAVNLSSPLSIPANSSTGNVSVILGNTLNSMQGSNLLEDVMLWMGTEVDYTGDARTHDPVTKRPIVHYDFKKDHLVYNSNAKQREGALNYLEYRKDSFNPALFFGEGMPFNQSVWAGIETTLFDPYATDSPLNYMREVDPDTGLCNRWMHASSMTLRDQWGPLPNHMCQIRDKFFVETSLSPDQSVLEFESQSFAYEVEITIPSGAISIQVSTQCPDSVTTLRYADQSVLTIAGTGTSLKYSLCSAVTCTVFGEQLSLPFSKQFSEFNQEFFFQAWPLSADAPTASNRCFYQNDGKGISLYVNKTYNSNSGLPDSIYQSTMQIVTADKIQTTQMMNIILDIVGSLAAGYTDLTTDQLILTNDQNITYLHDNPDLDDEINEFNNNVQRIANNSAIVSQIAKNMSLVLTLLNNLTAQNILNALQTQADIDALNAEINILQDSLNKLGTPGAGVGAIGFGFLDNIWHGIEKLLGLPFGLLSSLSSIMSLITTVIVIGLVICLCCGCLYGMKELKGGQAMLGAVQSFIPQQQPVYMPMPPRQTMRPDTSVYTE